MSTARRTGTWASRLAGCANRRYCSRRNPREQAPWAGARSVRQAMVVARTAFSIPAYPWVSCASGAFLCLRHRRCCGLRCGGCGWLRVLSGQAVLVADSVNDVVGRLPGASRVVLFGCRRVSAASRTRATRQRRASPANLGNVPPRDGSRAAPGSVRQHQRSRVLLSHCHQQTAGPVCGPGVRKWLLRGRACSRRSGCLRLRSPLAIDHRTCPGSAGSTERYRQLRAGFGCPW